MIVVADASVCIKWFFQDSADDPDNDQAIQLLMQVRSGAVVLIQPAHWSPEVVAVITRVRPTIAEMAIDYLTAVELDVRQNAEVLKLASQLSQTYSHHLFDTLYHALAINSNGVFVTDFVNKSRRRRRSHEISRD